MKELIFNIIFAGVFICLGMVLVSLIPDLNFKPSLTSESSNCSGLNLLLTSECLNSELRKFYNYNLSNMNDDLNLTQLKEIGGTCKHYSKWYEDNFINLGYHAKTITIHGEDIGHEFTIAWTKNLSDGSYCIADQSTTFCNNLGEINMTRYKELTKK